MYTKTNSDSICGTFNYTRNLETQYWQSFSFRPLCLFGGGSSLASVTRNQRTEQGVSNKGVANGRGRTRKVRTRVILRRIFPKPQTLKNTHAGTPLDPQCARYIYSLWFEFAVSLRFRVYMLTKILREPYIRLPKPFMKPYFTHPNHP